MSELAASHRVALGGRLRPLLCWCIRALWFVILPGLLAGLSFRYLIPPSNSGIEGALGELSRLATLVPAPMVVGLFVFFALVLRYWSPRLPGSEAWLGASVTPEPFQLKQVALWGGALLAAAVAALVLRSSVYQSYRVLSASMLPTLEPGAHLLTTEYAYGLRPFQGVSQLPRRGDVVVFGKALGPGFPDQLVKRVIGLPGDTISMKGGHPVINGWDVPSCVAGRYVYLSSAGMLDAALTVEFLEDKVFLTAQTTAVQPFVGTYEVQPGEVFVLGDNRNNSSDSRAWNAGRGGGLPVSDVHGRVDRLLLGVKRNGDADFGQLLQPLSGLSAPLEGLDEQPLRAGIERCLAQRPTDTYPPMGQSSAGGAP